MDYDPETFVFKKKPSLIKSKEDAEFIFNQINGVNENVRLKRVYLMSQDGNCNQDFHYKVDGKGAVVVLFQTEGGVTLGAYTSVGFTGSDSYKRDDDCVLFNLNSKFRLRVIDSQWAVEDFKKWGPRFDGGAIGLKAYPMNRENNSDCLAKDTDTSIWKDRMNIKTINGLHPLTGLPGTNFTCVECEVL